MSAQRPRRPVVVAVGLGPAGPEQTTRAAIEALESAPVIFLRTSRHPAAQVWLESSKVIGLDHCYETGASFDEVYRSIADMVAAGAAEHGRAAYAVPGSPAVAERTVELLRADSSIELEVVPGLSFCALVWARLGVDPLEAGVRLVDAGKFAVQAAGDPGPLLVGQCWSKSVLSEIKLSFDGDPGPAVLLHHLGLDDEVVIEVPWSEIDRTLEADHLTSLYVPNLSMPVARELTRLAELVRVLRDRCPWDREQTHHSLVQHLLEETYEAMEAIEALGQDPSEASADVAAHVSEELGDILCQVLFHATLRRGRSLQPRRCSHGRPRQARGPSPARLRRRDRHLARGCAGELGAQQAIGEAADTLVRGHPRRDAGARAGRQS
jgi:tetrapyrrole methylase family protein/MazG family protein